MLKSLESASQSNSSDSDNSRVVKGALTPEQLNFAVVVGRAIVERRRAEKHTVAGSPDSGETPQ
jgi:hypothetical protein